MQDSIWAGYVKVHQVNGVTALFITDITKGLSQSQAAKLPGDRTLLPLPWHLVLASNKHSVLEHAHLQSDQNKLSLSSKGKALEPKQL